MIDPPLVRFPTTTVYRIIPSRFPPVDLYREVAPAEDWQFLQGVAMRTNDRLAESNFSTGLIRPEDYVDKSNSSYILGPLSRPNPQGSRFADDSFGVLYAGLDSDTAQAEVIAQREAFMRATSQRPQRIDVRVVLLDLEGDVHDLRNEDPKLLHDIEWTRSLGIKLRNLGSYGLIFESKARPNGQCVAVFRPPILSNCRQERHFGYVWNGNSISEIIEYSSQTARRFRELEPFRLPGSSIPIPQS